MKDAPPLISRNRRILYHLGLTLLGIGLLMFLATFVVAATTFGNFDRFEERVRVQGFLAVGGIFLMIAGAVCAGIGMRGLAGAGLLLDPRRARDDLEPWARLSGQLTDTAFGEMHTLRDALANMSPGDANAETVQIIQVRCLTCDALNDETDRFCGQCGASLRARDSG